MLATLIVTYPQVCVKMCDPSKGAAGQKTIAVLLPCLLDKGIVSTVAEVRSLRLVWHLVSSVGIGSWFVARTPSLLTWVAECSLCLKWQVSPPKQLSCWVLFSLSSNSSPRDSTYLLRVSGLCKCPDSVPSRKFFSPCMTGRLICQQFAVLEASAGFRTGISLLLVNKKSHGSCWNSQVLFHDWLWVMRVHVLEETAFVTLFKYILCYGMIRCSLMCRDFICLSLCNLVYSFICLKDRKAGKFRPGV